MNISGLIHFFLFPGLLFAVPAAWFYVWGERKAVARMQRRIGPPLLQPFYDFVKLTGKRTPKPPKPPNSDRGRLDAWLELPGSRRPWMRRRRARWWT